MNSVSNNKYEALCCWCVDDDDPEDEEQSSYVDSVNDSRANDGVVESDSSHDIELRTVYEMRKAEEADNLVSYEEHAQLEVEELENIHEVFHVSEERNSNVYLSHIRRVMGLDEDILNSIHTANIESAFLHAPQDRPNIVVRRYNNLLEAQAFAYDSETSLEDEYYSEEDENNESSNEPVSSDGDETRLEIIGDFETDGDETDNDYRTEQEWGNIEPEFADEIDAEVL